jgi:hypothetical protein
LPERLATEEQQGAAPSYQRAGLILLEAQQFRKNPDERFRLTEIIGVKCALLLFRSRRLVALRPIFGRSDAPELLFQFPVDQCNSPSFKGFAMSGIEPEVLLGDAIDFFGIRKLMSWACSCELRIWNLNP